MLYEHYTQLNKNFLDLFQVTGSRQLVLGMKKKSDDLANGEHFKAPTSILVIKRQRKDF